MKQLSIFLYIILLTFFFSCEKDETMVMVKTDASPAVVTSTPEDLSRSITQETLADEMTINWDETDYGIDTEVSYTIEVDVECSGFENPVAIGSTTSTSFTITLEALNTKLLSDLKLPQYLPSDLQLRVVSKIKNRFEQISDPVTFIITPWSNWSKGLWLSGVYKSPAIYQSAENAYEGYAFIKSTNVFKLATSRTCEQTMYGGSDGQLSSDNSASGLSVSTTGYYRIKANTQDLTYELTLIESFGVIGSGTPGGWGSSTAMAYDTTARVWEATVDLSSGALKFRANNAWTINYGPANSSAYEGTLLLDDPGAISIEDPGNYTVTADFSRTKSPDITYKIRKNPDVPNYLWLPGEYQGWSPGTAPTIKSINASSFEGFIYITAPTGYKFTSSPDWDHINYGDSGTPGVLTTDGLAGGLGLSQAGYYKFNVNVDALTYTATLINTIGMIGTATPGSWDSSTAMSYDLTNDVWQATVDLVPGALKFRANDAWTINYGPADGNVLDGYLIFDDQGAINIAEAGNYTVTVDFSKSEVPYKYTYSVVKN